MKVEQRYKVKRYFELKGALFSDEVKFITYFMFSFKLFKFIVTNLTYRAHLIKL